MDCMPSINLDFDYLELLHLRFQNETVSVMYILLNTMANHFPLTQELKAIQLSLSASIKNISNYVYLFKIYYLLLSLCKFFFLR